MRRPTRRTALGGGFEDRQLRHRAVGELGGGVAEQSRGVELGRQHVDALGDVERQVVVADAGLGEQVTDDLFVHRRVLAEIEPAQVCPEHRDAPSDRRHHRVGESSRTVMVQRLDHQVEVGQQLRQVAVGITGFGGGRPGDVDVGSEHPTCERVQAGMHATQCPSVGLVGAERRVVARCVGERQHRCSRGDEPVGHRQRTREPVQRRQVVAERGLGLPVDGVPHDVAGHERIAVAVAADPGAHRDRCRRVDRVAPESCGDAQPTDRG